MAFTFNYDPPSSALRCDAGTYPDTVRTFGLTDGTIGNTNYTLIPFNSPNKAAAMVVQNLLLSGEAQLEKAKPEVWGARPGDRDRPHRRPRCRRGLPRSPRIRRSSPPAELAKAALPELQADWLTAIEEGWRQRRQLTAPQAIFDVRNLQDCARRMPSPRHVLRNAERPPCPTASASPFCLPRRCC